MAPFLLHASPPERHLIPSEEPWHRQSGTATSRCLVSVPVRLDAAACEEHVSFTRSTNHAVAHQAADPSVRSCQRVAEAQRTDQGEDPGRTATPMRRARDEELKTLQAESSEAMDTMQFVSPACPTPSITKRFGTIPAPRIRAGRAYALLLQAMEKLDVAAIAKVTLSQAGADRPHAS